MKKLQWSRYTFLVSLALALSTLSSVLSSLQFQASYSEGGWVLLIFGLGLLGVAFIVFLLGERSK